MSSDIIISVEGLGKRYSLRHQTGERYTALRDVVAEAVARPFRSLSSKFRSKNGSNRSSSTSTQNFNSSRTEEFWALKDINFEVRQGEVLGIIGRNGAGKSTLLKILSRITEPTEGRIKIRGRVASLLEVGTGFHPELTGRENIYLNGAILGMHRHEIKAKFDEIVAFAEVEKFLDTPVKRYSSGMYVRLAFAVAAHLEPEILVVDEVLAVGDAEFQKKCLGKMKEVSSGGRTVLFVSHNMGAVEQLCTAALLLDGGFLRSLSEPGSAIRAYLRSEAVSKFSGDGRYHHLQEAVVQGISEDGRFTEEIFFGQDLLIKLLIQNTNQLPKVGVNISFRDESGQLLCLFSSDPHDGFELPRREILPVQYRMTPCCLAPGEYFVDIAITDPGVTIIESAFNIISFRVQSRAIGGHWPYERRFGVMFPQHEWRTGDQ